MITEYNQKLVFNKAGKAANFKAQRLSDFRTATGSTATGGLTTEEKEKNMLFIFQVPLKQKPRPRHKIMSMYSMATAFGGNECPMMSMEKCKSTRGIEDAILEVGEATGPFKGLADLSLVRDDRFPIRCTIEYYKVTDTTELDGNFFKTLKDQLDRPYTWATDKGSLVVEGVTNYEQSQS